ncbi:circularly permuted type 2 ATP-grasp protein [Reichenbachiella carrageenanivorans]|uniref:Circularly permuted type 2 ATP-grasp protein n=1 Tax=Reichenbachiella carrageenanivorans TaxID=2979869 RepID=A0ABY6CXH6_9BACT|nr:circularly permuted type 2 ATP-grasp protein [Reichenbachiella carrageenanivorans]UXX78627.1 circularly permuted type 2 ATP-grasp protein [Reichenbachiella carrageenanivorans]
MGIFDLYKVPENCLDEVFENKDNNVKDPYEKITAVFDSLTIDQFENLNELIKLSFFNQGITYQVYSEKNTKEHIFPFDPFPRIIKKGEWSSIEQGAIQRSKALNLFLKDIYTEQKILKDKIIPKEMILSSPHYCKEMLGFVPKGGAYCHINGTDLIKHNDGNNYVLEDNLRSPSGVSYVLGNRDALKKTMSDIFQRYPIVPVWDYPIALLDMLKSVAPQDFEDTICVVLTPGMYNSAFYEHMFLAQQMGIELVEGRDLFVEDNYVFMKTTKGPVKVDVVYRRIDDEYLDPEVFNKESVLGVKGIMRAYIAGNVSIVNAPGTGVADDKAIYHYVPDIIKYYLGEAPILNNVHTYICENPTDLKYVLENLDKLVIKPVDQSGGYGICVGNTMSQAELADLANKIKNAPRQFIAQPIMNLSMHATYIESDKAFGPRHIDLRTYTLIGDDYEYVLKGGLSRVALKKGSLIVNSSQGGGSKDTWVIE